MNDDLMRQVGSLQTTVDDIKKPEISRNVITPFASLPGLIGLWYGGNYQRSTGDMPNLAPYISGASSQDLSYNGNPTFNYLSNGVGYADLDGTGDYFSVADNTDLDILGTESIVANPGLTMGGWFNFGTVAPANQLVMSKWGVVGPSYYIALSLDTITAIVSLDGGFVNISAVGIPGIIANTWYYIEANFTPATVLSIRANDTVLTETTAIIASIYNSNGPFQISGYNGNNLLMTGYSSIAFLASSTSPTSNGGSRFQQTRSLYGV